MKADRVLRVALASLSANLAFSVYHACLGFQTRSLWFLSLSIYYSILSVLRFALVQMARKNGGEAAHERFAMRFTGVMFLALAASLSGTTVLSAQRETGVKFHEIAIITIALYSFTKVTLGIINLVRVRHGSSPVIKALRNVSLADAFVSIFSLQRSMLVSFPGMSGENISLFNALTGSAVCIIVFLLGLNLIGGKKVTMAKSKIARVNEKIAETVVGGYKKVETTVVDGYKKAESAVVDGYTKLEDKFVDSFLTHEGESVEDAKKRLKGE